MNVRAVETTCVLMSALIIRMATHASVQVTEHFHRMDKSVEVYIHNNMDVQLTHALCKECFYYNYLSIPCV